jgi:hypothetical protein
MYLLRHLYVFEDKCYIRRGTNTQNIEEDKKAGV